MRCFAQPIFPTQPHSGRTLSGTLRGVHPIPGNPGIEQPGQANAKAMVVGLLLRGVRVFRQFVWLWFFPVSTARPSPPTCH
jgi:hypothetical protein